MKQSSLPSDIRIWTADTVFLPAVRVGGVLKPLCLMVILDQRTGLVTGYAYCRQPSPLSLIRLLNTAFHDFVPPDLIVADSFHDFDFDTWGSAGHHQCRVSRNSPVLSCKDAIEKLTKHFLRFLSLHFGAEPPAYGSLLLMTDIFFDDYNHSSPEPEVSE